MKSISNGSAKKMSEIILDERVIKKAVESYGSAYNKLKKDVSAYTRRTIQNNKLREKVESLVWEKIKSINLIFIRTSLAVPIESSLPLASP